MSGRTGRASEKRGKALLHPCGPRSVRILGQVTLVLGFGVGYLAVTFTGKSQVFLCRLVLVMRRLLQHLGIDLNGAGNLPGCHCAFRIGHQLP